MRAQREVVVLVPREPRQVEDDDEVNHALVRAAIREEALQLRAICRLRALALFLETFEDLKAFAAAVFLAGPELGRQAEILRLLLGLPTEARSEQSQPAVALCAMAATFACFHERRLVLTRT